MEMSQIPLTSERLANLPVMAGRWDSGRKPILIRFPIGTVSQTRDRLEVLQTAVALALRTLDRADRFGDGVALDGVADVLRAGAAMCQRACAPSRVGMKVMMDEFEGDGADD